MGRRLAACSRGAGVRGPAGGVRRRPSPRFQNTDVTGADFGRGLTLNDFNGKPRTLAEFKGKVVALFFGYTQCPDVCPTTLATMPR